MITVSTLTVKDRNTVEGGASAEVLVPPASASALAVDPSVTATTSAGAVVLAKAVGGVGGYGRPPAVSGGTAAAYDWSDTNRPWAYTSTAVFTAPAAWAGAVHVPIQTGSSSFLTNLTNTVNAAGQRVVVDLGPFVYHLTAFNLIGSSGDPSYAFGFWLPNLRGFLGQGADKTVVQMDANSMTAAQLNKLSTMDLASFNANQMGLCRFDGSPASPVLIAGVQFRSADQNLLTAVASDVAASGVFVPQPAPHQGPTLFTAATSDVGYCLFVGAGRAMNSQPPFEQADITSQKGNQVYHNCEFDGRRSTALDAAQPRRCSTVMGNNETTHQLIDCWLHDSNVSRYAVNDQNGLTLGSYTVNRVKIERITNQQNRDPAINGGNTLGGWTNATPFGWESCGGVITCNNTIIQVDNSNLSGSWQAHFQFTTPGGSNPRGGRFHAQGNTYKNSAFTWLDGYCTVRLGTTSYWWMDGAATTLDIRNAAGTALTGFSVVGTWPPSAATLAAAGVSPATHYLYKGV